jgi:hypothetical protein
MIQHDADLLQTHNLIDYSLFLILIDTNEENDFRRPSTTAMASLGLDIDKGKLLVREVAENFKNDANSALAGMIHVDRDEELIEMQRYRKKIYK